jgi:peptidoglycan/LPS O-acetylase OafA/YrhL
VNGPRSLYRSQRPLAYTWAVVSLQESGKKTRTDGEHLTAVDGLRALAVLSVVAFHTRVHALTSLPIKPFQLGQHGVELFFVISGLCLALPFLRNHRNGNGLRFDGHKFFAGRIVRILPPYYIAVAIFALLVVTPLWQATARSGELNGLLTLRGLIAHAFFAARDGEVLNGSFWTLRIEALWYLVFPFLLLLFVRNRIAFALVGIACAIAAATHVFRPPFGTVHILALSLPAFMLGIVAAEMQIREVSPRRWLLAGLLVIGTIAIVNDFHYQGTLGESVGERGRLIWEVAAFFLVALVNCDSRARRFFSNPFLVATGVASYSIYLIHEPLIAMLEHAGVFPPLAFAAVLLLGFAFWWSVERLLTGSLRQPLVSRVQAALALIVPKRITIPVKRLAEATRTD